MNLIEFNQNRSKTQLILTFSNNFDHYQSLNQHFNYKLVKFNQKYKKFDQKEIDTILTFKYESLYNRRRNSLEPNFESSTI